jgi:hypothetical protein
MRLRLFLGVTLVGITSRSRAIPPPNGRPDLPFDGIRETLHGRVLHNPMANGREPVIRFWLGRVW